MSKRTILCAIALSAAATLLLSQVVAQDYGGGKKDDKARYDREAAEVMDAWKKTGTPGKHHEHLKPLAGTWKAATKMRFSPDAPWMESTGKCKQEWILGGRYLTQEFKGEPIQEGGPPFEGFGMIGYDNMQKKYTSVWTDNMSTLMMIQQGSCNASGKVITLTGEFPDPMTGKQTTAKGVYHIINENKFVFELYGPDPEGKEYKTMEIVYTRT